MLLLSKKSRSLAFYQFHPWNPSTAYHFSSKKRRITSVHKELSTFLAFISKQCSCREKARIIASIMALEI